MAISATSNTFDIASATTATVTVTCPAAVYTGAAQSCTATTTPTGLTVNLTYNSIATAPTAPGTYPVVATISQAGYVVPATPR